MRNATNPVLIRRMNAVAAVEAIATAPVVVLNEAQWNKPMPKLPGAWMYGSLRAVFGAPTLGGGADITATIEVIAKLPGRTDKIVVGTVNLANRTFQPIDCGSLFNAAFGFRLAALGGTTPAGGTAPSVTVDCYLQAFNEVIEG